MNRRTVSAFTLIFVLASSAILLGRGKNPRPGPLTGTWDCTAYGGPNGDMQFTLTLEQDKDTVTGSVTSPIGSAEISDATYEKRTLEIRIEGGDDEYVLTGKLEKGKLAGQWTHGSNKGNWEGGKQAAAAK